MATVAQWTRLALTGDPESATPATGVITMLEAGASADLIARYPDCLTGAPGGLAEEVDQETFKEAVGYLVASRIVATPGGGKFAQFVVESKLGPVTRTRQNPAQTAAETQQVLVALSDAALSRISCVQEAMAEVEPPGIVVLSGRRRSLTSSCGCS